MFRVVSEFVPSPTFMLLCDHKACGEMAMEGMPSQLSIASDPSARFLKEAQGHGWTISLIQQLCPRHSELLKRAQEQMRNLVVPAKGVLQNECISERR